MGVFMSLRAAVRKQYPRSVILLYHRVTHTETDSQQLCVTPEHFAEQMSVLRQRFNPIRLDQVSRWNPHAGGVVVTFDDGYQDNLYQARPILERFAVPATVFATSRHIALQQPFWWDELEYLLLHSKPSNDQLELRVSGQCYRWPGVTHTDRQRAYSDLMQMLMEVSSDELERILSQIRHWRAKESAIAEKMPRALTIAELQELAKSELIEIGAHTRNHVNLAQQPFHVQIEEIEGSRRDIETWLGRECLSFSYPFGFPGLHYGPETTAIARRSGYRRVCANNEGWVTWRTSPYQYPRYLVRDWDGDEFHQRLRKWFEGP